MTKLVGQSTIYGTILPNSAALARIQGVSLGSMTREARHRFRIINYYLTQTHKNISALCRHFSIVRSYFYKWYRRFQKGGIAALEAIPTRPKHVRRATYNTDYVSLIRRLRIDYPMYSAKKLAVIICRDYDLTSNYSSATIGRIIYKFNLFFRRVTALRKLHSRRAKQAWKLRKPYGLTTERPHHLIEFDMKHIRTNSNTNYAFVAVDVVTKQSVIHVAKRPSSYNAKAAMEKVLATFGTDVMILNDNGSENMCHTYNYLKEQNVTQYFARPHTPKDKPHVENLIGKLQLECLDEHLYPTSPSELQAVIDHWVNDYHYFRPHQALGYKTPAEFCATMGITIPHLRVSTM